MEKVDIIDMHTPTGGDRMEIEPPHVGDGHYGRCMILSYTEDFKSAFKDSMEGKGMCMSSECAKIFYARIGLEDSGILPFVHPFYWAAFTYTGC